MVRDQEIQRLINYAKGLGLKVSFTSKKGDSAALWTLDNTEIIICKRHNTSKIETILSLIHEIAHAKHCIWEKDREFDTQFEEALDHVNEAEELDIDSKKRQRKVILNNEIAGTNYWHEIYKDTDLKFPLWRLETQMEFDIWQYHIFCETGSFPSRPEWRKKWKEIKEKYRRKYSV